MRFVEMSTPSGERHFVNPLQVMHVVPYSEDETRLYFVDTSQLTVALPADTVAARLSNAAV